MIKKRWMSIWSAADLVSKNYSSILLDYTFARRKCMLLECLSLSHYLGHSLFVDCSARRARKSVKFTTDDFWLHWEARDKNNSSLSAKIRKHADQSATAGARAWASDEFYYSTPKQCALLLRKNFALCYICSSNFYRQNKFLYSFFFVTFNCSIPFFTLSLKKKYKNFPLPIHNSEKKFHFKKHFISNIKVTSNSKVQIFVQQKN